MQWRSIQIWSPEQVEQIMTEEKSQAVRAEEERERAEWKRPELHRISAGDAESGASGSGSDNAIYS